MAARGKCLSPHWEPSAHFIFFFSCLLLLSKLYFAFVAFKIVSPPPVRADSAANLVSLHFGFRLSALREYSHRITGSLFLDQLNVQDENRKQEKLLTGSSLTFWHVIFLTQRLGDRHLPAYVPGTWCHCFQSYRNPRVQVEQSYPPHISQWASGQPGCGPRMASLQSHLASFCVGGFLK